MLGLEFWLLRNYLQQQITRDWRLALAGNPILVGALPIQNDGIWSKEFENSIKQFQKDNGSPVTGKI